MEREHNPRLIRPLPDFSDEKGKEVTSKGVESQVGELEEPYAEGVNKWGNLCTQRYRVNLSEEYEKEYYDGMKLNRNITFYLKGVRGAEFPVIVDQLREINLDNASVVDVGTLIRYFGYRGRTMEEILSDNLKWERI